MFECFCVCVCVFACVFVFLREGVCVLVFAFAHVAPLSIGRLQSEVAIMSRNRTKNHWRGRILKGKGERVPQCLWVRCHNLEFWRCRSLSQVFMRLAPCSTAHRHNKGPGEWTIGCESCSKTAQGGCTRFRETDNSHRHHHHPGERIGVSCAPPFDSLVSVQGHSRSKGLCSLQPPCSILSPASLHSHAS